MTADLLLQQINNHRLGLSRAVTYINTISKFSHFTIHVQREIIHDNRIIYH
uniref:Uncharacterized protein n=1 Tax=Aegilops tauschii subsp. strangulata TaxID=200361 RepID=A0A453K9Y8_AEGTS